MTQPILTPETPSLSGWRALGRVLTDPVETFRSLGSRPPILPGYLLQMVIGLLVLVITLPNVMAIVDQQIAAAPPGGLDPAILKWVSLGSGVLGIMAGPWLVGLALSVVALFVGQFQGGGVTFSAYFGMLGYARVPLALSALLSGIFWRLTGKELNVSLAALLSPEASPYLKGLLSLANPFGLWYYALLAVGFAALFGRPPRRGWAYPALLFVIAALFAVGGAGFTDRLAGFQ